MQKIVGKVNLIRMKMNQNKISYNKSINPPNPIFQRGKSAFLFFPLHLKGVRGIC
jgi:hypothetical protein